MEQLINQPTSDSIASSQELCKVYVESKSALPRLQWTKASVTFSKGEIPNLEELNTWGIPNVAGFYEWKIIKWHFENGFKHSIAVAQIKFAAWMPGPGSTPVSIVKITPTDFPFTLHPNIQSYLGEVLMGLRLTAKFVGDLVEYEAFPFNLDNLKVLSFTKTGLIYRSRSHLRNMSLTAFVEVNHLDAIIRTTLVLGNDTFETPIQGGLQIRYAKLESDSRVLIKPLMPSAYGINPTNDHSIDLISQDHQVSLGDGQTAAFRVNALVKKSSASPSMNDIEYNSYLAECQDPMIGFCDYERVKGSKALNLYQEMVPVRFTDFNVTKQSVEASQGMPYSATSVANYLDLINMVPGSTGAQPDFSSTVPSEITKSLQLRSQTLLLKNLVAVDREALRPSYYWKTINGVAERVSNQMYPNLLFWGSRPHPDPSHYNQYPEWRTRGYAVNFNAGDFSGWQGHDNQHISNNHLRTMYELTGDPYLGDLCKYYISICDFNYFNPYWGPNAEAERCMRMMKEALSHALLFSDSLESQMLIEKIKNKMNQVFMPECQAKLSLYGMPTVAPFDACLAQFAYMNACPATGDKNILAVCWQSPFHMEFLNLMLDLGIDTENTRAQAQLYVNAIDDYFDEHGVPYTYVVLTNHLNRIQGGIGIYWWAGWCNLMKHFPSNPRIELLKGLIRNEYVPEPGKSFDNEDGWASF